MKSVQVEVDPRLVEYAKWIEGEATSTLNRSRQLFHSGDRECYAVGSRGRSYQKASDEFERLFPGIKTDALDPKVQDPIEALKKYVTWLNGRRTDSSQTASMASQAGNGEAYSLSLGAVGHGDALRKLSQLFPEL